MKPRNCSRSTSRQNGLIQLLMERINRADLDGFSMEHHYVLSGVWFDQPRNVEAAIKDEFGENLSPEGDLFFHSDGRDITQSNGPPYEMAVHAPDWGGIVVFHCSWGDGLSACEKLKAHVIAREDFDSEDEQFEWEDQIGEEIVAWVKDTAPAHGLVK